MYSCADHVLLVLFNRKCKVAFLYKDIIYEAFNLLFSSQLFRLTSDSIRTQDMFELMYKAFYSGMYLCISQLDLGFITRFYCDLKISV
jgi:hypothetical protein